MNAKDAILDGEMVVLDAKGRPDFSSLQMGSGPATYIVFDVLQVDGRDVTALPYEDRRRVLEAARRARTELARVTSTLRRQRAHGCGEGARARRHRGEAVDSPYEIGRRSGAWRKVKYRPQQEFVVGGWVPGTGNREHTMGAILVGVYEKRKLRYAGRVGTGFKERELQRLMARFAGAARQTSVRSTRPPASDTEDRALGSSGDGGGGGVRRVDAREHPPPAELYRRARRQEPEEGRARDLTPFKNGL